MRLCFDIGNTRAKCALYDGPRLVDTGECTEAFVDTLLRHYGQDIERAVASVVGQEPDWGNLLPEGLPLHRLSHESPLPFRVSYDTPETLGADRLAAALGAWSRYPEKDLLIIDAGSCITVDTLLMGTYLGGAIMPGLQMMFDAMHEHTARLPRIEAVGLIHEPTGRNTADCMKAGVTHCIITTLREYSERIRWHRILLTGGNAEWLKQNLTNLPAEVCPDLVFEGLNSLQL